MELTDDIIYEVYHKGWLDCLDNKINNTQTNEILIKAYDIGTYDAYYGDELSSIDCQTKEEIINHIKS